MSNRMNLRDSANSSGEFENRVTPQPSGAVERGPVVLASTHNLLRRIRDWISMFLGTNQPRGRCSPSGIAEDKPVVRLRGRDGLLSSSVADFERTFSPQPA